MSGPRKVLCIFCGQRRERAVEDIVSHWLAKEVGGEPPFFAGDDVTIIGNQVVARGKARPYGSAAALKLPQVCKPCNTGWMSLLERRAKPLLVPMIRGRGTSLTPAEQRIVAAWAQLKMISYDARRDPRSLPATTAHEFSQVRQPRESVLVLLGAFEGYGTGVGVPHARRVAAVAPIGTPVDVTRVSLGFGFLFIQVLDRHELCDWPIEMLAPSESCWVRCWPEWFPFTNLRWPPPVVIGRDSWWTIA